MGNAMGLHLVQKPAQRMTQILQQAINLLHLGNADLSGLLIEEAARNPALRLTLPLPDELPAPRRIWRAPAVLAGAEPFNADAFAAQATGLYGHVTAQIGLLFSDPQDRQIAMAFAEALEPSGWLGDSVTDLARAARCSHDKAERVLLVLQTMEPTGLFARSLSECLGLQLADRGALDAPMQRLLDNLPALGRGDSVALMQRCGVDAHTLGRMVALLRSLDPKPGTQFDTSPDLRRAPDLVLSRDAQGGWQVALNRASTPEMRVDDLAPASKEARTTAHWLERTLSRRNQIILRVAAHAVAHQQAFLDHGPVHLRPLTCGAVAAALGLHETTVGRIRSGLLIQTPQRVLPLRALFGRGRVTQTGKATLAGEALAALIGTMIATEDPACPLSDDQLVQALAARGVTVSRRTLTNWRNRAGHPGAAYRKRP